MIRLAGSFSAVARRRRRLTGTDLAGATRDVLMAARRPVSSHRQLPLIRRSYGGVRALGALTVAVAVLIGCSSALAAASPQPPAASYLFSIPTASGSLTGPNDQHLTLRLTGTRDYLTRFTDRPLRQAFVVANVDFAKRFKGYFADSDPNAVLTYTPRGSQIPVSIVLTIGQPRWNATRSTWTFPATRIRKQPDNLPGFHIKPPSIPNPRSFKQATLFIDSTSLGHNDNPTLPPGGCLEYPQLCGGKSPKVQK
jgi:hypothetical protein